MEVEGVEMFRISQAWEESLFFAFQSFEFYQILGDSLLPGCPEVSINEVEREVSLTFSSSRECVLGVELPRSGTIKLSYQGQNFIGQILTISYSNYKVKGIEIEGTREFVRVNSGLILNRRVENFSDLIIIDENGSSSRLSGTFSHRFNLEDGKVMSFTSSGNIMGRNITGRNISMEQSSSRQYQMSCLSIGKPMPVSGEEIWSISRYPDRQVNHKMFFEQGQDCQSTARVNLQDGRNLTFSQ